jgi:hypothetical protein
MDGKAMQKPTETLYVKNFPGRDPKEVVEVEIELPPLLAAIQELVGLWEHIHVSDPLMARSFDFALQALDSEYQNEVAELFRNKSAPMRIVEDNET